MKRKTIIAISVTAAVALLAWAVTWQLLQPGDKTPSEIYRKQASGVALVLNEYYYTATLPDQTVIYISGYLDKGVVSDISFDLDDLEKSV